MPTLNELWNENGFLIKREDGCEIRINQHIKGEDPDPKKRAELRAEAMRWPCPSCGKPVGEHTPEETRTCAHKQRDIKLKDVRCSICNKLVLEHSESESAACSEKDQVAKCQV
jgi:endogenous inhibitor of DNA gyrase (YacG/DUF329 family)